MTTQIAATALSDHDLDAVHAAGYARDAGYAVGNFLGEAYTHTHTTIEMTADFGNSVIDNTQEAVEDALQGFVDGLRSGMNGGADVRNG